MQHAARHRLLPLVLGTALATAACCDDCDDHDDSSIPVYFELEPNDLVDEANDFGVLFPGDSLLIEADIVDSAADPFDGFAFTAGQPIHVDFIVYVDDPLSELEVGLYDPEQNQTLGYYLQDGDLIYGGVDVLAGGFDFHLVVESIVGATTYGLQIDTYSLYESQAAPAASPSLAEMARDASQPERLVAHGARAEGAAERFAGYSRRGSPLDEEPRVVGRLHVITLDETDQDVRRSTFDLTAR